MQRVHARCVKSNGRGALSLQLPPSSVPGCLFQYISSIRKDERAFSSWPSLALRGDYPRLGPQPEFQAGSGWFSCSEPKGRRSHSLYRGAIPLLQGSLRGSRGMLPHSDRSDAL